MWNSLGRALWSDDYDNKMFLAAFRPGVDYSEEVHRSVKNSNPREGYLRQWLVWGT